MKEAQPKSEKKPRRARTLLKWGLVAFVGLSVAVAVGLLWKPAGATRTGGRSAFLGVLLESGASSTALDLLVDGSGTLVLSETDIAALLDACLDRSDLSVPSVISRRVRQKVPGWVTGVSGCLIESEALHLYFTCGQRVTVYVTLSGALQAANGSLSFKPEGAAVGLFPLPQALISRIMKDRETTLIDAEKMPVRVTSVTQGDHIITITFKRTQEDFR